MHIHTHTHTRTHTHNHESSPMWGECDSLLWNKFIKNMMGKLLHLRAYLLKIIRRDPILKEGKNAKNFESL